MRWWPTKHGLKTWNFDSCLYCGGRGDKRRPDKEEAWIHGHLQIIKRNIICFFRVSGQGYCRLCKVQQCFNQICGAPPILATYECKHLNRCCIVSCYHEKSDLNRVSNRRKCFVIFYKWMEKQLAVKWCMERLRMRFIAWNQKL